MKKLKLYSAIAAVLLIVIVILQNTQSVTTKFLFFTFSMPNAALIALTLLIGIAAGMLGALTLKK
jgi:lipopolysaccharide assembly protein A